MVSVLRKFIVTVNTRKNYRDCTLQKYRGDHWNLEGRRPTARMTFKNR